MKRRKYGNVRTTMFGIKFDSKREAHWYAALRQMESRGEITDLQLQVNIALMGKDGPILTPTGRQMNYRADFVFRENGKAVVMDAKGFATDVYKIKKAILRAMGIEIVEV